MKLYELDSGDKFRLAGDDRSPVFIFDRLTTDMSSISRDEGGEVFNFIGNTPVIRVLP